MSLLYKKIGIMMRPLKKKEDLIDKEKNLQSESKNEKPSFQDRVQILLIDDDLEFLELLSESLKEEFDVLITNDGKKGLQIFKERSPDLVITDIFMPKIDGLKLTHLINQYGSTPVIVLSGYTKELKTLEKELLKQESVLILQKPIKISELLVEIKKILRLF